MKTYLIQEANSKMKPLSSEYLQEFLNKHKESECIVDCIIQDKVLNTWFKIQFKKFCDEWNESVFSGKIRDDTIYDYNDEEHYYTYISEKINQYK